MYFYRTAKLNCFSYVKVPMPSSATLNFENDDEYCFIRSILAHLHPCENSHHNKVSNYMKTFNESNFDRFNSSNGLNFLIYPPFL